MSLHYAEYQNRVILYHRVNAALGITLNDNQQPGSVPQCAICAGDFKQNLHHEL